MQLLDALTHLPNDHGEEKKIVRKFLYGQPPSEKISEPAQLLLDDDRFAGDDYALIEHTGENSLVIGNDTFVFKLEAGEYGFGLIPKMNIPEELAAKIITCGKCNGIGYALCERLETQQIPSINEIIPYLFKARDTGLVYTDPKPSNFGYGVHGNLKVLDHEHFEILEQTKGNFGRALRNALNIADEQTNISYPLIVSDNYSVWVVFDPYSLTTKKFKQDSKKVGAILSAIGIGPEQIETISGSTVIRITKTELMCGTAPESPPLADYLRNSLRATIRTPSKEEGIRRK